MDINAAINNSYSPGGVYLRGNPAVTTATSAQSHSNADKPQEGISSANPPDTRDTSSTGANGEQQDTVSSSSQPEKQPSTSEKQLTQAEFQLLTELKQTDTEVKRHEMAHVAAGGSLITSGASFTYKRGPDGKNYAVAGEVSIDTSAIPGDPGATQQKMKQVKRAALAPASPSAQDLKVAASATSRAAKASAELAILMAEEQAAARETRAFGNTNMKQASDSYTRVNNLPEGETSTFQLAV